MSNYQADGESDGQPNSTQEAYKIIAIAASAGGLNALSEVLSGLPGNFPATMCIIKCLEKQQNEAS